MTLRVIASDYKPRTYRNGHRWGRWRFVAKDRCLEFIDDTGRMLYDICLTRCQTSAQILDWLCQVSHKQWATSEDVGNLVRALDDLVGGLQSRLCGSGAEKAPIDWQQIIGKPEGWNEN